MHTAMTPLRMGDDLQRAKHADALARLIEGEVRFGKHDRMLYATDASIYQVEPIGVVIPAHIEDVRRVIDYCREHALPLLPRGGGTSLAGQCTGHAVVMDLSVHLTALERVDTAARRCMVQPGITIEDLNDQLRATGSGLFFAPDPATARHCNIGGAIGNNAAGTRSILYGRTSENIEAVSVILSSGQVCELAEGSCVRDAQARALGQGVIDICMRYEPLIRERFPRTIRRNAGYALDMMLQDIDEARRRSVDPLETLNLAHLICGSEGTLAVVTGATLMLHPIPKAKGLAVLGFATLEEAIDCVVPLLELKPSAVELLDDMVIGLARENIEYGRYVTLMPQPADGRPLAAVLYVEFFSSDGAAEIDAKFNALRTLMARLNPRAGIAAYTDAASMTQALKLRKAGEPLLHGIPGARKPLGFVEDNAVPVERLAEFVREFKAIVTRHGTTAAYWAHASVGVLHVRPLLDLRSEADRTRMERIATEVADLAKSVGGVMSGEHGDGRVRGPLLERYFGPELMGAFREVKALFDPANILNPGNIVSPGPIASIHEKTRVRPSGFNLPQHPVETYFDYGVEGGFDHAVELCNGSGVCRKKTGGTMCPSYMATLDERHSTRGRGNALRLAITGQLKDSSQRESHGSQSVGAPSAGNEPIWGDKDTLDTLHLCLSCKACKTECPSNVDVAKYKAEYLAQTYRHAGRTPLKAIAFGRVRLLNRIGSAFAPLSNWVANHPLHRAIVDRVLGIAKQRTLPAWDRSLFRQVRVLDDASVIPGDERPLLASRDAQPGREAPTVVLYADCFTTYNDPSIGIATIRALRACGYRVVLPKVECCGRAQISTGLLGEARSCGALAAKALIDTVRRERAVAVVACEPSCLSSIKDDWLRLQLEREGVDHASLKGLAAMSWLPEDFIDRHWDSHPRCPALASPDAPITLHGHCHQKALWGVETSARLLRRLPGANVTVLDSGCCGMAGSFGYTADRYDLSMKIGELVLFPALRALKEKGTKSIVVAPGTSCRHQIHDGVAVRALHPMELFASLLER